MPRMIFPFDNSYARLPSRLFAPQAPMPVAAPDPIAVNRPLAIRLGVDADALAADPALLTGNRLAPGAEPIAQAYAGHQFGNWVPQLGDGRAVLLGEVVAPDGARFDIALKGSGPTPYSRRGDGRAWVGPVIREYVVSEAMHALGVPTTRALAAARTGETVWREQPHPGAVLMRVAASHIRVGTFQFLAARADRDGLEALTAHVIGRHYSGAAGPLDLFARVQARQAELIARWVALGFVHGVMNTDNMAVSGETIDYGPCAFLDVYEPGKVFSSIDRQGRYAYLNQPAIAMWNLTQFASCLIPLMGDEEAAIAALTAEVNRFPALYEAEWLRLFGAKIGLAAPGAGDEQLVLRLLAVMAEGRADFTRTFRGLATGRAGAEFAEPAAFSAWEADWRARLAAEGGDAEGRMRAANPAFIPRNHRVEEAINAAVRGDLAPFERLNRVLARPYDDQPADEALALGPAAGEEVMRTFCGT